MNLKSVIAAILLIVTIVLSFLFYKVSKLYRMFIFIDENAPQSSIDRLAQISKYQNIVWILVAILAIGLISIIVLQYKEKVRKYLVNMY